LDVPSVGIKAQQRRFFVPSTLPQSPKAQPRVAFGEYIENDHGNIPPEATKNPEQSVENEYSFKELEDRLNEYSPEDHAYRPFDIEKSEHQVLPMDFLEENLIHSSKGGKDKGKDFFQRFKAVGFTELQLTRVQEGVRLYRQGGFAQVASAGFTGHEILSLAYFLDRHRPYKRGYEPIPLPHFATVQKLGGLKSHSSQIKYLKAASAEMGRKFRSTKEVSQLVVLAKLFDLANS
jgi:hypothetical protein